MRVRQLETMMMMMVHTFFFFRRKKRKEEISVQELGDPVVVAVVRLRFN